jgi:hypothetical protein
MTQENYKKWLPPFRNNRDKIIEKIKTRILEQRLEFSNG